MDKARNFFYVVSLLVILSAIASFFIDVKSVIIILFSLLLLGGYVVYKERIGQELIVAFIISLAISSYYFYEYTAFNIIVRGINLFPLVSWTFGLVVLREIYERLGGKYRFVKISIFYVIAMIILEYVGYNIFGIRLNSNFPGFWKLEILHSPNMLRAIYFITGPVYLAITDYLKVK